jgi:hypothetical protein
VGGVTAACTAPVGESGAEVEGGGEAPESEVVPEIPSQIVYQGLSLDSLETYKAIFQITFTPEEAESPGWTYRLDILAGADGLQRSLSMQGVSEAQDLGDVTLTRLGDTQYMTGEATGDTGCLIFPASVDIETSFLMPDDLLLPDALTGILSLDGAATVAGLSGQRYTFEADAVGDFRDVSGELVLSDEGGIVLRYGFAGSTAETPFSSGLEGRMTWQFEITDFSPEEAVVAPEGCELDYPIMADATDLARLPGMIAYTSSSSPEDVQAFYEQALPDEGWQRYDLPETSGDATVLVYAREGWLLNVAITAADGGSEVQLFPRD